MVIHDPKKQKKLTNKYEELLFKAMKKAKSAGNFIDEGKSLMALGGLYMEMEEYKKATLALEEASAKFIMADDPDQLSHSMEVRKNLKEVQKEIENVTAAKEPSFLPEYPKMLDQFIKGIIGSMDLSTILNNVIQSIIKLTEADRGFLILIDEQGKPHSKIIVTKGEPNEKGNFPTRNFSQHIIKEVLRTQKPVFVNNVQSDQRFTDVDSILSLNIRSRDGSVLMTLIPS